VNARVRLIVILLATWAAAVGLPATAAAATASTLTLTATPATVVYGETVKLRVTGAAPGAALVLSRLPAGAADYVPMDTVMANDSGAASWTVKPVRSSTYRVETTTTDGAISAEVGVSVRRRVRLNGRSRTPLLEGRRVRFTVTVRPRCPGATVRLSRRTSNGWQPLRTVVLGDDSSVTTRITAAAPGRLIVRAETAADAEYAAGRSTAWRRRVYDRRNPYGVPSKYPHLILVDLSRYRLFYHEHGIVIREFKCVLGRPSLPTPRGRFKIYAKDPKMGGPYGPRRLRYLGLYAIHGTNEPWLLKRYPRNYSHGCTRLSNTHIKWLYSRVHVGTPVWNVP
jgi:lipoprotein-anchoring transpeptidase ErfK/SrfK